MNEPIEPTSSPPASAPPAGQPHPHESAHLHVAGEATYVDDLPEPAGTAHAALGLSTQAHARIVAMDLDAVLAALPRTPAGRHAPLIRALSLVDRPEIEARVSPWLGADEPALRAAALSILTFRGVEPGRALGKIQADDLPALVQAGIIAARSARYTRNHEVLVQGMRRLGYRPFLDPAVQGPIICSFHYPTHPAWDFERFYALLSQKGHVIYPGKVSRADCFRIGTIGDLHPDDVDHLLHAIAEVLHAQGLPVPLPA